jgi:hypothetical protein
MGRDTQGAPGAANLPQGAVMTGAFGKPGVKARLRGRSRLRQVCDKFPGSVGQESTTLRISAKAGRLA